MLLAFWGALEHLQPNGYLVSALQGRRQVCNSGGAVMLLSAYMQIFSLKVQCIQQYLDIG